MINLMYLFLTAMLALNVSAEILSAFVLINDSIKEATENVNTKNEEAYMEFEKAFQENPKKVAGWYDYAKELKIQTDALDTLIQDLKWELVHAADGDEGDLAHINKKDDNNVGGEVMLVGGRGAELKAQMDNYRNFVIGLIPDTNGSVLARNIMKTLSTDDMESHNEEGVMIPWESANFEHLPLIAVIAMMSKMQNDLRNVESDMLSMLLSQIDAGSFKFNTIKAIVNAPNSYVKVGEEFRAEVFIAAYDSTQNPVIVLDDGTELDVEKGKGVYEPGTGSPGTFSWGGKIILKNPSTGDTISFPFENEYQVVAPSWAISPTAMNVLYIGLDNPIQVTATGRDISASISGGGGRLTPNGGVGKYIARVSSQGTANISVIADGSTAGTMQFRCLPVPSPRPLVGTKTGGYITKNELIAMSSLNAKLDNFVFNVPFTVTGYTISTVTSGFVTREPVSGNRLAGKPEQIIRNAKSGQEINFIDIKCKAPDGGIRNIGSMSFTIR